MKTMTNGQTATSEKLKIVAQLMRRNLNRGELAHAFQVEIRGQESIFDALIREGQATGFAQAVELVGRRFPPSGGGTWGELASWVAAYDNEAEKSA